MKYGENRPIEWPSEGELHPLEPDAQPVALDPVNHDQVAAIAYRIWQERGCPIGSDQEDWYRAEAELKNREVLVATDGG